MELCPPPILMAKQYLDMRLEKTLMGERILAALIEKLYSY
jgi:hypothetical protein